jgi:hypothetical protein
VWSSPKYKLNGLFIKDPELGLIQSQINQYPPRIIPKTSTIRTTISTIEANQSVLQISTMQIKTITTSCLLTLLGIALGDDFAPWPQNCMTTTPFEATIIRPFFRSRQKGCYNVGAQCRTDSDCLEPDAECIARNHSKCQAGICRVYGAGEGQTCTCYEGCAYETRDGRYLHCLSKEGGDGFKCVAKPCAPCGETPSDGGCCAPGVTQDGKCYCALRDDGEGCSASPQVCSNLRNGVCCRSGNHEDRCCNAGTCDGQCTQF